MFRNVFCLILLFCFMPNANCESQFDLNFPLKGDSMAKGELRLDALRTVYAISSDYNKKCQAYSIVNTRLIQDEKCSEKSWQEVWTVGRCGILVDVPVLFILDENGIAQHKVNPDEVKMFTGE